MNNKNIIDKYLNKLEDNKSSNTPSFNYNGAKVNSSFTRKNYYFNDDKKIIYNDEIKKDHENYDSKNKENEDFKI